MKLILVRHGESQWNLENRFTGWYDIDLSKKGKIEAKNAAKLLKSENIIPDIAYTSLLKRAIYTLWYILKDLDCTWISVKKSWKLNERHYGDLQGLNKDIIIKKYGSEQVKNWRRGFFDIPPPAKIKDIENLKNDKKYKKISNLLPVSESLFMTFNRVIAYWQDVILKNAKYKKNIMIVAHGNSLRALIKYLNNLNEKEIIKLDIPTGVPIIYKFNEKLKIFNHYYLK